MRRLEFGLRILVDMFGNGTLSPGIKTEQTGTYRPCLKIHKPEFKMKRGFQNNNITHSECKVPKGLKLINPPYRISAKCQSYVWSLKQPKQFNLTIGGGSLL